MHAYESSSFLLRKQSSQEGISIAGMSVTRKRHGHRREAQVLAVTVGLQLLKLSLSLCHFLSTASTAPSKRRAQRCNYGERTFRVQGDKCDVASNVLTSWLAAVRHGVTGL